MHAWWSPRRRPGNLDNLAGFWDTQTVTGIASQQGNRGFLLFPDAAIDRVVALSVRESGSAADAAGRNVRSHVESVSGYLASPPELARLDLVVASGLMLRTPCT